MGACEVSMLEDRKIIGVDMSSSEDNSVLNVSWRNDGLYTKECIKKPIMDNERDCPIGVITDVNEDFVSGVICGRYASSVLQKDFKSHISVEIENRTENI